MKTFTFRYEKKPLVKAFAGQRKALRTGDSEIRDDELVCDSLQTMLDVMSKSRFETFAMIVERKPNSLYELAKLLEKNQSQILREARSLEALGLIELQSIQDGGREKLKPHSRYHRIAFEFPKGKVAKTGS